MFELPSKLANEARTMRKGGTPTFRQIARLLGTIESLRTTIRYVALFYQELQKLVLKKHRRHYRWSAKVCITTLAQKELLWWEKEAKRHNGIPIHAPQPSLIITSDASLRGWGAICGNQKAGEVWDTVEQEKHINELELLAAFLGLQRFARHLRDSAVLLRLDNTTAVAYINHQGGTRSSKLGRLAVEMGLWAMKRNLTLVAQHVPGDQNGSADAISWQRTLGPDWHLAPAVFRQLCRLVFLPAIDLFSTRESAQLPRYVTQWPDQQAEATDAFSLLWQSDKFYMFPPPALIRPCLQKITTDQTDQVLFIAPGWPQRPWFTTLLGLLYLPPVLINVANSVTALPDRQHQLSFLKPLIAWPLSATDSRRRVFLQRCKPYFSTQYDQERQKPINLHGRSGTVGVWEGRQIPLIRLSDSLPIS